MNTMKKNTGVFYPVPDFVAASSIPPSAKLLYAFLLFSSQNGIKKSWTGQEKLGQKIGVKDRQVRRLLSVLESRGLVTSIQRGVRLTNLYVVVSPDQCDRSYMSGQEIPGDRSLMSGLNRSYMSDPIRIDKVNRESENKEERGKGTNGKPSKSLAKQPTANSQDTGCCVGVVPGTEGGTSAASTPSVVHVPAAKLVKGNKTVESEDTGKALGSAVKKLSREEYTFEMSQAFQSVCGFYGKFLLEADLASHERVVDWTRQRSYWAVRFSRIDDDQKEAWCLIARYLEAYHIGNRCYPDTRDVLKNWRASDWVDQKKRIRAYTATHGSSPMMTDYVQNRATETKVVNARWLLSASDYQMWIGNQEDKKRKAESESEDGTDRMERNEELLAEHMEDERKEQTQRLSLNLITRAGELIRRFINDDAMKGEIGAVLKGYRDGDIKLAELRHFVEGIEGAPVARGSAGA